MIRNQRSKEGYSDRIPSIQNMIFLWGVLVLLISGMSKPTLGYVKQYSFSDVSENQRRPNIIIIYSDDQGVGDIGIYGGEDIQTPHLDRLAERGVRFTQMYAPSSICSPSRAGLLTGRYPQRAGMPGNASPPPLNSINDGNGTPGLSNDQPSMGKYFNKAGYQTVMIGKWHLGYNPGNLPSDHGFDYWFGHLGGVIDNYSHFIHRTGPMRHDLWRNGERVRQPGKYFPDLMVREAKQFINDHKEQRFFLYYALNVPHFPLQPDTYWLDKYQQSDVPYPRNLYGAFVSSMDERIGILLNELEELGLTENTIIIFQSDNGHAVSEPAHFGGGSSGPYRGAKRSLFEGGIRVPAIISWPGVVPENEVRDQMVHAIDWLPTLAEWLNIDLKPNEVDGKSIVEIIESGEMKTPHDILFWERTYRDQWAVRKGPWKLYANAFDQPGMPKLTEQDKKLFLVNLEEDPSEQTNLVDEFPLIVENLKGEFENWKSSIKEATDQ